MTWANDNRFLIPAWGVSLTLHGVAVALAVLFAAQVRPVFQEEPFKWDVALVESVNTDSIPESATQPAVAQTPQIVPPVETPRIAARWPVEPPPDPVMHHVAPQQTVQMVHPEVTPPKPVEQREEPVPLKAEPVTPPVKAVQEKIAEPIKPQAVEAPKTQPEPVTASKEPEPVHSAEPVMAQRPLVEASPPEAVESRSIETPAKPSVPEPVASSPPAEPTPAISSSPSPAPSEAPVQTAHATAPGPAHQEAPMQTAKAAPGSETKTDHRWLAESLWRRVGELKRYPSSARLNGQEGKVVLKAVIRSDGHLIEVSVQKSSGHQILDAAAIEAVKLACPLHMKQAINKPEIVVSLPIVYSLAN
jgi:periplasmic protein TonB